MKKTKKTSPDITTATTLALILGVSPDTVRSRARRGLIPYTMESGKYVFSVQKLTELGILPAKPVVRTGPAVTRVQFVIDRSGSMLGLEKYMEKAIKSQLESFSSINKSDPNQRYFVGQLPFGTYVQPFSGWYDPNAVASFLCTGDLGATNLYAAIQDALARANSSLTNSPDEAHLIIVITDGEETQRAYARNMVAEDLKRAASDGRITVVVNCPPQGVNTFIGLGVPAGNIRAWEGTEQSIDAYSKSATLGTTTFAATRGTGATSTSTYYANPGDLPVQKLVSNLDQTMDDVTMRVKVARVPSRIYHPNDRIKNFADKNLGGYQVGHVFYELVKKEKVQQSKEIIIQDVTTGKFYHGWGSARKLLGLPSGNTGTVNVSPGRMGEFKVFVQSTSYTRRLPPNTAIISFS